MIPLVFLVLRSERELEIQRQEWKNRAPVDEERITQPAPQAKEKNRRQFDYPVRQHKKCECP